MGMDTLCTLQAHIYLPTCAFIKMNTYGNVSPRTFVYHSCQYVTINQVYIRREGCVYMCVFIHHMKYTYICVYSSALNFGHE